MAISPIDLHWNLTTPEAKADGSGAVTYPMSALPTLVNDYFKITDDYLWFWAPVAGEPTAKSTKTRSEMRECDPDSGKAYNWPLTGATHAMGASLSVDKVSNGTGGVFVGQIHAYDFESPPFKFKYQYDEPDETGRMIVSLREDPDGNTQDTTLFRGIPKGKRFLYYVKVSSTGLLSGYVEYDGVRKTFTGDLKLWVQTYPSQLLYFKAGAYNNAEPETSTGEDDGAEVRFFKLTTTHS